MWSALYSMVFRGSICRCYVYSRRFHALDRRDLEVGLGSTRRAAMALLPRRGRLKNILSTDEREDLGDEYRPYEE